MMSEPKNLHRMTDSEWHARAIKARTYAATPGADLGWIDRGELRVVFTLKGRVGNVGPIVDHFVSKVWPEYHVTEYCRHRHGVIVTVEEGP